MSLVLTTTTLWISEIKQLLTSPIAQQKIHGLKRIEITCKKSFDDMYVERSNILINQGIIEMLCEIALSSEIRVVLLTLQCLQVLSVREAFFLGNRWEIVVATLRKLSCSLVNDETEAAKKIFLNACSITYKISNKLGDVSSVWPDLIQVFKNVVEKLRIESVYYIADAIGRFVHENAETQLDLETLELALKIFRCVIEHFKSQSIENELQNSEDGIWENEMISMGEMGIVFMKRCICPRSQYPSSQESTLNYEFLLAFEHVFLPVLLKCKFERSMKLVKEDLLTICLKSADSLFYHPSMEFKVDCSEKIFPVLYDAFPIIESSSSKHCKSLARKLLADVLSGLCFKDFSSFNADLTFEYWYSYFKEGLERLKFNISCVPRFIKNNTWGAWSMVIMHYFCIRSNSSNVVSSDELFDAISRQVLLISRKGKHLDLVSAKVIWLVFAKHYVMPREGVKFIDEATCALLELIEENVVSNIFTRHEAILSWTFNVPSSRKLKMKVLDLWLLGSNDEKTEFRVISLMTESIERCQLLMEITMRSPPTWNKLRSRFQLLEVILSNCNDEFKEAISTQYWDELEKSITPYLNCFSIENCKIVAEFFSAGFQFLPHSLSLQSLSRVMAIALQIISNFRDLVNEEDCSKIQFPLDSGYFHLFSLYLDQCAKFGSHEVKEALISLSTNAELLLVTEASLCSNEEDLFLAVSNFLTKLITMRISYSVQDCARRIVIHSKRVLQNICSRQPHQRATIHMLVAVCENELSSIQSLAMIHPLNELVLRKFFLRVPALMQLEVNRDEYWKLFNKLIMISRRFLLHYHLMTSSSLRALATLASTSECTDETQFWNKWILSVPEENEMSLTKTSLVQISKMLKTDLGPALKLRSFAPKKRLRRVTFSEEVKLIPY